MPLPVGHTLAGIAFSQVRPGFFFKNHWHDAFFFILLANLPDADFLPGIILGQPSLYHHGAFHSLGAMMTLAAAGGCFFYLKDRHFWSRAAAIFLVGFSHLLLDFFTFDFAPPYGLPLFWPFSGRYFIAARPFFLNITRSEHSGDFFTSLFSRHNLEAALRETLLLGGLALIVVTLRLLLKKRNTAQ
jgi:inner membrane protein